LVNRIFGPGVWQQGAARETVDQTKKEMENNSAIAAAVVDFQAILTNELGDSIKKDISFFLLENGLSTFEREMIAEKAFERVLEKREKFQDNGKAKFSTWAKTVARNFATDELRKLDHDLLHKASDLDKEQSPSGCSTNKINGKEVPALDFLQTADFGKRFYWKETLKALKGIVSTYNGRDRTVAEMLIKGDTKEEITDVLQMSGACFDTCIHRLRKRMRSDLLKAGYDLSA